MRKYTENIRIGPNDILENTLTLHTATKQEKLIMIEISDLYARYLDHPVVTTDTRDCPPGSLFFALRGATFDGNAFACQALESGCAYAVVDDAAVATDDRFLLVPDVLTALQQLAALHRRRLGLPVIQITGTNGKTTTKELTTAVLARRFNVLATLGNFNNHIGVPKTLLRLTPRHELAVIETGANHPGEIATLSRIADPDYGLITNVGKAHLEGFGSFEGVVRTKGELYDYLRQKGGTIFLDADNPHLCGIAGGLTAFRYGAPGKGYDVEGELTGDGPLLSLRWRPAGGEWNEVTTHLVGSYNLTNALAAAAVGTKFGVAPADISQALTDYMPTNNRSELLDTGRNRLIVDAYNANPTSMAAALDNFARIRHDAKMAILGDMRELGPTSDAEHQAVVDRLPAVGCREVWLVGDHFSHTRHEGCRVFKDVEAVKAALAEQPLSDRLILIKGSNGTRLFELPPLL